MKTRIYPWELAVKGKHMIGIHADHRLSPDYELMKEAGIEWLRVGFSYPYEDRIPGNLTKQFQRTIRLVRNLRRKGFKIMGVTPLTGSYSYNKALDKTSGSQEYRNGQEQSTKTDTTKHIGKDAERLASRPPTS